jgi:hypothetical protein
MNRTPVRKCSASSKAVKPALRRLVGRGGAKWYEIGVERRPRGVVLRLEEG